MIDSRSLFDRVITYKGIIHERAEDAPFMGALIISNTCSNNCQGCFNQHLKEAVSYYSSAREIIDIVAHNLYNDGIILGGLEWSEQPEDAIALIQCAKAEGLQVMLYTGLDKPALLSRIPEEHLKGCYVKFGKYEDHLQIYPNVCYGVRLASSNQYIEYFE